ncbi:MAG: hypothetical protein KKE23_01455 [Nanoarchaeota archaeon]|nr:hypothetical protein [Nanoarchaeota archaeon]
MVKETKYGVISDVHADPRIVPVAINVLKKLGAEKLLINGDIGNNQETLKDSQNYVAFILDSIGKSGLESFVQPGSHETLLAYGPVIEHFSGKYHNLIDVIKTPKVEQNGHQLVFLPGSDFICGGEYSIGMDTILSGKYIQVNDTPHLIMASTLEEYVSMIEGMRKIDNNARFRGFQFSNMNDLRKLVNDPAKTTVVCHVPRKFDNIENCVDVTEFGEVQKTFFADIVSYKDGEEQIRIFYENGQNATILKPKPVENYTRNQVFEKGSVFPIQTAQFFKNSGAPVEIKRENRGNEDLKKLYEELGITKAVSGHFHESGHRANDSKGNKVPSGQMVSDLFWNSGHLDVCQTGILTIADKKASYININLQDHLD